MIGVVVNPHAGRNRGQHDRLRRLQQIVGKAGVAVEPSSLAELDTVVAELKARAIQILAVCGGDGSFFRTLSSLVRLYGDEPLPKFLPLRAGSMNTIAAAVGCRRGSPEKVLSQIVADYAAKRTLASTERQLMHINGEYFGFMTGAGAVVNFLRAYYDGAGRGALAASSVFGRALVSGVTGSGFATQLLSGIDAAIEGDAVRVAQRHFNFVYASTINEIGLGVKVTYRGDERPGYFHLIAGDFQPLQVVRRVARLWRGQPLDLSRVHDSLHQAARIEFPQPTQYMIDGDVLGAVQRLDLAAGPRLTILR